SDLGFVIQGEESEDTWETFFEYLKDRNLTGLEMVVSDAHKGLVAAIRKSFTNVSWQRCQVHFLKNILSEIPKKNSKDFRDAVKAIFRLTNINIARTMKNTIVNEYIKQQKYKEADEILDAGFEDALQDTVAGHGHKRLKSTNVLERLNEEVLRRENVIRIFPNLVAANRLIGAVLMDKHEEWVGYNRKYISLDN